MHCVECAEAKRTRQSENIVDLIIFTARLFDEMRPKTDNSGSIRDDDYLPSRKLFLLLHDYTGEGSNYGYLI